MTAYAEVIGDPIAHSQSPVIYGFWLKALKIDAEYRRTLVSRADFPDYLAKRRTVASASNTGIPARANIAATVDFPMPIEPVRASIFIAASARGRARHRAAAAAACREW